jgi:ribose/xylose/arabinose/galactoside ABC-type transport system permease subunit
MSTETSMISRDTAPDRRDTVTAVRDFGSTHKSKLVLVGVIVLLGVVTASQDSHFLTWNNAQNILIEIAITGILACGQTLIMVSGGIDLSVGSSVSMSGTAMALLMSKGMSPVLAVIIGVAIATAVGATNGTLAAYARTHPFIITLGGLTALQGGALLINALPINVPSSFLSLANDTVLGLPLIVFVFLCIAILCQVVLRTTTFGRKLYAIGGSEASARLAGIRVRRVKILVYTVNGILVGVAAMLLLAQLASSAPQMGQGLELAAVAAVAVGGTPLAGGRGDMVGTFLGVLLLGLIVNSLTLMSINPNLQYVIQGLVIIVAVMAQRGS